MARPTCMSRPAKPARHSCHARIAYRSDLRDSPLAAERGPCRVSLVCRASCAGRGMALANATIRLMSTFPLRPETQSRVGALRHRGGGVLLAVSPQRAVVLARVPQLRGVLGQGLEYHLAVQVHAKPALSRPPA